MKVFISVDMEGISGLVRWADVASRGIDYPRNRRLMTLDVNAAINGAIAGGATEIVVEENHGVEDLCNLLMDEIDPRCRVVRGAGRPGATTMAALDEQVGVVLLVGHHGAAGSFPGIMAHTISYEAFRYVRQAGQPIGEPYLFALRAAELGVPVGMVSGDQVVAAEVSAFCPWVEQVVVKEALGNQAGNCVVPAAARELIEAGAERAVRRALAGELACFRGPDAPYEFEVELKSLMSELMRDNLAGLAGFTILDDRTVGVSAANAELAFRRIAYLGYADRPGVTRH